MFILCSKEEAYQYVPLELTCGSPSRHINQLKAFAFHNKTYRMKAETLFHIKTNLLGLVCWHVVCVLFALEYFSLHDQMDFHLR